MMETRGGPAALDDKTLEVRQESSRFVVHHFTILHWLSSQDVVQLGSLVCSSAGFVLGGLVAQPEVQVIEEFRCVRLLLVGLMCFYSSQCPVNMRQVE